MLIFVYFLSQRTEGETLGTRLNIAQAAEAIRDQGRNLTVRIGRGGELVLLARPKGVSTAVACVSGHRVPDSDLFIYQYLSLCINMDINPLDIN